MLQKIACIGCTAAILSAGGTSVIGLLVLAGTTVGSTFIPVCVAACKMAFF